MAIGKDNLGTTSWSVPGLAGLDSTEKVARFRRRKRR